MSEGPYRAEDLREPCERCGMPGQWGVRIGLVTTTFATKYAADAHAILLNTAYRRGYAEGLTVASLKAKDRP